MTPSVLRRARASFVVVGGALACAALSGIGDDVRAGGPGTAPSPAPSPALIDNATCERCHDDVAAQWRTSRHAVAASNAMFLASWRRRPDGWCLQCHAPRDAQQRSWLGVPAEPGVVYGIARRVAPPVPLGVDCVTCHIEDGVVLSSSAPSTSAQHAHATRQDPRLADERVCARCHEFPFPHRPSSSFDPRGFSLSDNPAQTTITEWRAALAHEERDDTHARDVGRRCQECHMAAHGHRFVGAHDVDFVRSAVDVCVVQGPAARDDETATREGPGLRAIFTTHDVLHRVPTGDPFRSLELDLCDDAACAHVRDTLRIGRRLGSTPDSWQVVADATLGPSNTGDSDVRELPAAARDARHWRLRLHFGERVLDAALPSDEIGAVLREGTVCAIDDDACCRPRASAP